MMSISTKTPVDLALNNSGMRQPRSAPHTGLRRWASMARALVVPIGFALASVGCASLESAADVRDSQARAEQRWSHLIQGRHEMAWALHSPGWRALHPFDAWRGEMGSAVSWKAAEAVGADCDDGNPKRCTVRVKVTYQLVSDKIDASPLSREVEELWLNFDDQWWYLPRS